MILALSSIRLRHADRRKGQEILPNMFEKFAFYQPVDASSPTIEVELQSCDLDDAPERFESGGELSA